MIQVKKFTDITTNNGYISAIKQCNDWLTEHKEYQIIDIKYQVIADDLKTYDYILVIYDNFTLPDMKDRYIVNSLKKITK